LFDYNTYEHDGQADNTNRIGIFWDKLFISTKFMINGLLEAAPHVPIDFQLSNTEIATTLNGIIDEIKDLVTSICHNEPYSVDKLKVLIIYSAP
jgi:hypothetical protein